MKKKTTKKLPPTKTLLADAAAMKSLGATADTFKSEAAKHEFIEHAARQMRCKPEALAWAIFHAQIS